MFLQGGKKSGIMPPAWRGRRGKKKYQPLRKKKTCLGGKEEEGACKCSRDGTAALGHTHTYANFSASTEFGFFREKTRERRKGRKATWSGGKSGLSRLHKICNFVRFIHTEVVRKCLRNILNRGHSREKLLCTVNKRENMFWPFPFILSPAYLRPDLLIVWNYA